MKLALCKKYRACFGLISSNLVGDECIFFFRSEYRYIKYSIVCSRDFSKPWINSTTGSVWYVYRLIQKYYDFKIIVYFNVIKMTEKLSVPIKLSQYCIEIMRQTFARGCYFVRNHDRKRWKETNTQINHLNMKLKWNKSLNNGFNKT